MSRRVNVIDGLWSDVNAQYDHALVPATLKFGDRQGPPIGDADLLGFNVIAMGAIMNKEHEYEKQKADQESQERRKLKELQAQLGRERRKKEKMKKREIVEYHKALAILKNKEVSVKRSRRPRKGEHAGDNQRRRHELNKMLLGDFTSLERPAALNTTEKKFRLEPVLQHWMPQFKQDRPSTQTMREEHEGNTRRHKNVKKAIQRQRWVKMLNSNNFSLNQRDNIAKLRAKKSNKLGDLNSLMKQQQYTTAPDSLSQFVIKQAKEAEGGGKKGGGREMDVDMRTAMRNKERRAMGAVAGIL